MDKKVKWMNKLCLGNGQWLILSEAWNKVGTKWCKELVLDGEEIRVWAIYETSRKTQLQAPGNVDLERREMSRLGVEILKLPA